MRTFHVPLQEDLHDALRREARDLGQPATEIVRRALTVWLEQQRKRRLHDAITEYALAVAGTGDDLDEGLEDAGIEALLAAEP